MFVLGRIIVRLSTLKRHQTAIITAVQHGNIPSSASPSVLDPITKRLVTLGFVPGERVKVLACGLFGADPLLVQIGFTRFALRRSEAARIQVTIVDEVAQ
jgi:ferrous iron transport protein A